MSLTEAVDKIIQEFGVGVVSEKRFLYMLCDYHSFRDVPAEKNVCSAILDSDYLSKFISLNSDKQIDNQIRIVVNSISYKYGLKDDLIQDVLLELCKGLPNFSKTYKKIVLQKHTESTISPISNINQVSKRKVLESKRKVPKRKDTPLIHDTKCIIRQLLRWRSLDEVMKEYLDDFFKKRIYKAIRNSDILDKRGIIKRNLYNEIYLLDGSARLDRIIDIIFPVKT